jgi:hypothetical protein
MRGRSGARFVLIADVSKFYSTIRTDSVAEHLMERGIRASWASDLVALYRSCQAEPGLGLPIGPDASHAVAEIIMANEDVKLRRVITKESGFRYVDDFECGFDQLSQAEDSLGALRIGMGRLGLALHPKKTRVLSIGTASEAGWAGQLRGFTFRSEPGAQRADILGYSNLLFGLRTQWPDSVVIKFALTLTAQVTFASANFATYEAMLYECARVEPGAIRYVLSEICRYRAMGHRISIDRLTESIVGIVADGVAQGNGNEVAWALWGAIVLQVPLPPATAAALERMDDGPVALLTLDAKRRGLISQLNSHIWTRAMDEGGLWSKHWLLAYEGSVKMWLRPANGKDFISKEPFFKFLRDSGTTFYNLAAPLAVTMPFGLAGGRAVNQAAGISPS